MVKHHKRETVRTSVERDDFLFLASVYASGNQELGDALATLAYPSLGKMGARIDPEKLEARFQERAETRRMYERLECGHSIRNDLLGPNGECPECDETARRNARIRETAEWVRELPDDERNQFVKHLFGFDLVA